MSSARVQHIKPKVLHVVGSHHDSIIEKALRKGHQSERLIYSQLRYNSAKTNRPGYWQKEFANVHVNAIVASRGLHNAIVSAIPNVAIFDLDWLSDWLNKNQDSIIFIQEPLMSGVFSDSKGNLGGLPNNFGWGSISEMGESLARILWNEGKEIPQGRLGGRVAVGPFVEWLIKSLMGYQLGKVLDEARRELDDKGLLGEIRIKGGQAFDDWLVKPTQWREEPTFQPKDAGPAAGVPDAGNTTEDADENEAWWDNEETQPEDTGEKEDTTTNNDDDDDDEEEENTDNEETKPNDKGEEIDDSGRDFLLLINEFAHKMAMNRLWNQMRSGHLPPERTDILNEFKYWLREHGILGVDIARKQLPQEDETGYALLYWLFSSAQGNEPSSKILEYWWRRGAPIDPALIPQAASNAAKNKILYLGGQYNKPTNTLRLSFM